MNPSSQPYQPGELPPVPPAFPGDAAAASSLRKADGAIQCPKCREDATGAVNPNRGLIAALRLSRRS